MIQTNAKAVAWALGTVFVLTAGVSHAQDAGKGTILVPAISFAGQGAGK